jgi:hypothetical protein
LIDNGGNTGLAVLNIFVALLGLIPYPFLVTRFERHCEACEQKISGLARGSELRPRYCMK